MNALSKMNKTAEEPGAKSNKLTALKCRDADAFTDALPIRFHETHAHNLTALLLAPLGGGVRVQNPTKGIFAA